MNELVAIDRASEWRRLKALVLAASKTSGAKNLSPGTRRNCGPRGSRRLPSPPGGWRPVARGACGQLALRHWRAFVCSLSISLNSVGTP